MRPSLPRQYDIYDWARGRPTAAASAELCLCGIAIIAAPYGVQALLKALLEHLELAARVAGGVERVRGERAPGSAQAHLE